MSSDNPNFGNDCNANSAENANSIKIIYARSGQQGNVDRGENVESGKCGWFCFRPSFLQVFRTPKWVLFWLCWAGALQGLVVNGFVNIVITTIEKRFGMNSFQTGLIAGGYDIASFICLIPVTYLGGRTVASKPRWLGLGVVIMGIGSLVFASPYVLAKTYNKTNITDPLCQIITNSSSYKIDCNESESSDKVEDFTAMWLFFIGQLLHGAGASPLFTLGVTYIDENVSKKMSSVYIGVYYTTAILGPALGYVLGGQMLELYTDFLTVSSADLDLTSRSNSWVGAWWLGFVISTLISLIIAIPLLAFPPVLPDAEKYQMEKESEAHAHTDTTTVFTKLKEIPKAFRALIVNPTFFFLNMAGASEGLLIAGFAAFLPKVIENQFGVNAKSSSIIMGIVTVPAGGGGTYLGGYLVKKFKLRCAGIIKLCIYSSILSIFFSFNFLLTCPDMPFAGINKLYRNTSVKQFSVDLNDNCNSICNCDIKYFSPICSTNNVTYFSPCYAGCLNEHTDGESKVFSECSCIQKYESVSDEPYDAIDSMCVTTCQEMWSFVGLSFGTFLFTFLSTMPALTATLRCVRDDERSFALGIQWIKVRLLGTIPAPIIFGTLIDKSCILWQQIRGENGACLLYNNEFMSIYMLALAFTGKCCSLLFFSLAWWFYVPPKKNEETKES